MKVKRLIEDVSYARFLAELVHYVKKYPDAKLDSCHVGDDNERAEGSFMFHAIIIYDDGEAE